MKMLSFNLSFPLYLHYAKKARTDYIYLTKEDVALSKFITYILSGSVLMLIAIAFILYAANNPQAFFPWGNSVTYVIYGVYGLLTGLVWGLAFKYRPKQ